MKEGAERKARRRKADLESALLEKMAEGLVPARTLSPRSGDALDRGYDR
jgi:hypothetical protein